MAGIGQMAEGKAPSDMQAGQSAQSEGGDPEAESNVTPEEQATYDMFMQNALEIIYPKGEDAQVSPNILNGLNGTPDKPLFALASTAVTVVVGLRDSAKRAGSDIPEEILFHAGADIVAELAEVAEAAKIHEFSEEEIETAFYIALDLYRNEAEASGNLDKEGAQEGLAQIQQANQAGTLDQLLPGVSERAK